MSRDLEARLQRVEDELAILRLIARYFPLVDAGDSGVTEIWEPEGSYEVDTGAMAGRAEIAAMVEGSAHQGLLAAGAGHVPGLPLVELAADGESAVATQHTQLVVCAGEPGRYRVLRVTANRWELVKRDGRWQVARRVARALGPDGTGRELLGQAARGGAQ